jgi:hypothetical protein
MDAVTHLAPTVGVVAAGDFLGAARASFYRQRPILGPTVSPVPEPVLPAARPTPGPALSPIERASVLTVLHEERFQDRSPATVQATWLDEGQYLCSIRTMYRILEDEGESGERRNQLFIRLTKNPSCWPPPQPIMELGHHQAAGCGHVDLLLSPRDPRCLQPLRRRLDGRAPGKARNWPSSLSRRPSASTRFPPGNSPSVPTAARS